ncbi:unnamed protein product [Nezara viridula]|uniref:Calcineurin-like phosphoesterase domain-containing protein n=1 Tax=Nezara viridula TaxID=85310 RepID=A0A9P0MT71_NEZVI|nr:unnamed protein product [Nezara viridula]
MFQILRWLWNICKYPFSNIYVAILSVLFGVTVYFEVLSYFSQSYINDWPSIECGTDSNSYKLFFVADPQILGENTESWVARMDCDRFLKISYKYAMNYVNPDLIIFLGDLMDEGSMCSSQQYSNYFSRFRNIFHLNHIPKNKTIFLPGDNDIGGENEEVTPLKLHRYENYFGPSVEIVSYKNIKFFKVNSMTRMFPEYNVENDTSIRIVLSHIPLLGVDSFLGEEIIMKLRPHAIFSAHDHKLMHFMTEYNSPKREIIQHIDVSDQNAFRFTFSEKTKRVNEISIPTVSYRMGTLIHGYSAVVIDKKQEIMCYFFFRSPRRLLFLNFYLILLICCAVIVTSYYCIRKRRKIV